MAEPYIVRPRGFTPQEIKEARAANSRVYEVAFSDGYYNAVDAEVNSLRAQLDRVTAERDALFQEAGRA